MPLPTTSTTWPWSGTAFNLIVLVVAALGIKLSARFQWLWAIFEYGLLVGFTIAAVIVIYGGHRAHTVHLTSSWFTISGAGGFKALISGVLLAISFTPAGTLPPMSARKHVGGRPDQRPSRASRCFS